MQYNYVAAYVPEKQYNYLTTIPYSKWAPFIVMPFHNQLTVHKNDLHSVLMPENGLHASRTPKLE